jgi:hypothetical protein
MKDGLTRSPVEIDVDVIGGGHGEWDLRVTLSPMRRGIQLIGVTVVLFDGSGERLGPTSVVPSPDSLDEVFEHEFSVSLDPGCAAKTVVARCQALVEGESEPIVVQRHLRGTSSFTDHLEGADAIGRSRVSGGRALSSSERARVEAEITAAGTAPSTDLTQALQPAARYQQPPDANAAFKAFSQDFVDAFGLDPDDELTEELLKLIQES